MTTQESIPPDTQADSPGPARTGPNWGRVISLIAWLGFLGFAAVMMRTDVDPRVANPNVEGRPRPVGFLTGFDHWQVIPQVGALIMVVVLTIVFIRGWRKNPGSPVLMMVLVTTLIVWQDPIMNWSPYAVYNPMLLHWPESWPLIMMSPTVEPFIVFGYVTFYFGPYFPAIWILRKMQAKRGPEAFVARHPLISLGALVLVIGFIFDAILEISLVRTARSASALPPRGSPIIVIAWIPWCLGPRNRRRPLPNLGITMGFSDSSMPTRSCCRQMVGRKYSTTKASPHPAARPMIRPMIRISRGANPVASEAPAGSTISTCPTCTASARRAF